MSNGDYISREDAKNAAALIALTSAKREMTCGEVKRIMENIPPADVQPVVLCRKCKFCEKRSSDCLICHHPKNAYHAQARFCEPDDFCSYGEAGEWDGRYGDERSDA